MRYLLYTRTSASVEWIPGPVLGPWLSTAVWPVPPSTATCEEEEDTCAVWPVPPSTAPSQARGRPRARCKRSRLLERTLTITQCMHARIRLETRDSSCKAKQTRNSEHQSGGKEKKRIPRRFARPRERCPRITTDRWVLLKEASVLLRSYHVRPPLPRRFHCSRRSCDRPLGLRCTA